MPVKERIKNATPDMPDIRDRIYEPALIKLLSEISPPEDLHILDQGYEGACTGFAIAAVINRLLQTSGRDLRVSPRMLYEMAKRSDEWPGEEYDGSSLRGAIRGWKNMGVCSQGLWPYLANSKGELTIERAKDARSNTIGAYYRLRPVISDFHAALNETQILAVSAKVHRGWNNPQNGIIRHNKNIDGGHAFAIVGYNKDGFWVQNSWGTQWGKRGLALWTYEDWVQNISDAWAVRLALPTPQIFGAQPKSSVLVQGTSELEAKATTPRSEIAGHFVHIDDGKFKGSGRYWSTSEDVKQTAKLLSESPKYDHLLVYAHGGLNAPKDSAIRIHAMKNGYKQNGIYPFHVMYDTGLVEEIKDVIFRKSQVSQKRVGGFFDWTDRLLEGLVGRPGTILWEEMKNDANDAFKANGAGTQSLKFFIKNMRTAIKNGSKKKKIHLVGHSTGAILLAHLIKVLASEDIMIESCNLMAPACRVDLYNSHYLPSLQGKTKLKIKRLNIYNLGDSLEQDDNVMKVYRKSLLYLVSNAFERNKKRPLLGMEKFKSEINLAGGKTVIHYSNGVSGKITRSRSHGGFDNDIFTMNDILSNVLGKKAPHPFKQEELDY